MVSIIDRDFLSNRPGKGRTFVVRVSLRNSIRCRFDGLRSPRLLIQIADKEQLHPSETPAMIPAGILYNAGNPISITGNGEFTSANGVVGGSGTASDP